MSEALVLRVRIETSHEGMGTCQVVGISGGEAMNQLYRYEIELESDVGSSMFLAGDGTSPIHQRVKLILSQAGVDSYLHGQVIEATYTGSTRDRRHHYRIVISSMLWCHGQNRRTRVFPAMAMPEVVDQVLHEIPVTPTWDKSRSFPTLSSITQYQESDLAFISRLLETEGVWWCFRQKAAEEQLFICDHSNSFPPDSEAHQLRAAWQDEGAVQDQRASITNLTFHEQSDPLQVRIKDYNPDNPGVPFAHLQQIDSETGGLHGQREELDENLDGQDRAAELAQIRADEIRSHHRQIRATSNLPSVRVSDSVMISGHPVAEANGQYLVTSVRHQWSRGDGSRTNSSSNNYSNALVLLPYARLPYVPRRLTPLPKIPGLILGTVMEGPGNLEGSVAGSYHVRMRIDEDGAQPQRLVRMAEPSTGANYGTHWPLPVGAEVVMSHINGDPDRPVIAGAMPNVEFNGPVAEANNTQAVWKGAKGNEVIFEDKDGSEFIRFTAVKHWERHVKADSTTTVGNNATLTVEKDSTTTINGEETTTVKGNATLTISKNSTITITGDAGIAIDGAESHAVKQDRTTNITGEETWTVGKGLSLTVGEQAALDIGKDAKVAIGGGLTTEVTKNLALSVSGGADLDITKPLTVSAKKVQVKADDAIEFTCGSAKIILKSGGDVTIEGSKINIKSSGDLKLKGSKMDAN